MKKEPAPEAIVEDKLVLKLYISGMSPKSLEAVENLKQLCDEHLQDAFDLEIIDIYKNPELAITQSVVFCPSLVKQSPLPRKILIGTLNNPEQVVKALGIKYKKTK